MSLYVQFLHCIIPDSHDRIVVSTSRCGRENPGSNAGHGRQQMFSLCMTSIAARIKNPFRRTSEHNHSYNYLNLLFFH